jgi:hypothetical protein
MSRSTKQFTKWWDRYGLTLDELREIDGQQVLRPFVGQASKPRNFKL